MATASGAVSSNSPTKVSHGNPQGSDALTAGASLERCETYVEESNL
jgi:hypothetical protein